MAVSSSPLLMASQTRILTNPNRTPLSPPTPTPTPTPTSLSFRRTPLSKPPTLTLSLLRPKSSLSAASSSPPLPIPAQNPTHSPLTGSTRTITTIFSLALSLSKLLALKLGGVLGLFPNPITPATATGPLFFAAISEGAGPRSAGTPIAVIAAGLARWLEIYSCVLLIRVLLSWFPNIPWEKQPFSAVRDLCDPYLSLFRGIIPPLFNSLDVSPILAFLLLGMLGQFARAPRDATLAYKAEALNYRGNLGKLQNQDDMLTSQASSLIQGRRAKVAATSNVDGPLTTIDDSLSARNLEVCRMN